LPIRSEWVLHLDADERLTPELAAEIQQVLQRPSNEVDGFMLRKRTVFMGRWIRHVVDGRVERLRHDYVDVITSDLRTWTLRHLRWAELEIREITRMVRDGPRVEADPFGNPIERRRWLRERVYQRMPLFVRAFLYFLYRYFVRLGLLDGKEGLIFHFLQGCWYRFLVDAMLFEAQKGNVVRATADRE
jgi:hypothetical protein